MKHKASSKSSVSASRGSGKGGRTGKGKVLGSSAKASNSTSGSSASTSNGPIDLKDIPLSLPNLSVADHHQWVPRYHAVLKRSESDGVGLEDIDALQLELEAMLAAAVVRKMTLKDELEVLKDPEKYRGTGKNINRKDPPSPSKRSATPSGSPIVHSVKRFKSAGGKPSDSSKLIGLPKIKSEQQTPAFDPLQNEQIRPVLDQPKPTLPKNETPNRFWAFVEPYCAPITVDDVKLLEDLVKTHDDMSEYFRIPPLGQHYTQRWAKEDMENERVKGASNGVAESGSSEKVLKKAENSVSDESTPYGELTQRLVGGLMEENLMTSVEDSIDGSLKKGESSSEDNSKANLIKSLNVQNTDALEARVRKELEEQGILNPGDEDEDGVHNDEILEELKRCQNELKAVSAHNLQQLQRLLKAAKEEIIRQEVRKKLSKADLDVMDAYQKVSSARSRKKPLTKKERDAAWKSLKERDVILRELELN